MFKNRIFIYFILVSVLLTACAKRGTITGGAKDTIPPSIVSSSPKNMTTGFKGKEIHIDFDEYVKVKDVNKQLIISPPMKYAPEVVPAGSASRFINIKIKDTLQDNTTYSFNFGQSITDNNEGNPYSQFRFVFSTGTYIDSLMLNGKIKDALKRETDNFVTIMLYEANETFNDSTIYKERPRYVTNTLDSLTVFSLQNLKAGKYHIFAMKDVARNYIYNPKVDKLAFLEQPVSVPNDTVFMLELFQEKLPFAAQRPAQTSANRLFVPFTGKDGKGVKSTVKNGNSGEEIRSMLTNVKDKDSLQLWVPRNVKADSLAVKITQRDTVRDFMVKFKEMKAMDSLSVDAVQKGGLHFREQFTLKTSTPIVTIDKKLMSLVDKDSVAVPFTYKYDEFEQRLVFDFKKDENQKYVMQLLPGALIDFYEKKNDTLNYKLVTKPYADYGNLVIKLENVKRWPVIVEITDEKGEVYASQFSESNTEINFESVEPKNYVLRLIYDDNKNQEWDTGDYRKKLQPEEVIYFPKLIEVHALWDVEQPFPAGG
ncbi:Ig-like domain-containing protein [Flavobacterium psychrotrophum]|uniref:Ig-like domain-containing protein n=1 Tax=Flavobacterium psychrotrophum TaxID=2294119 RepID=UPI000E322CD9|nr:Ig-like domain-containing protein [Flavobacterium psychrotrophum]